MGHAEDIVAANVERRRVNDARMLREAEEAIITNQAQMRRQLLTDLETSCKEAIHALEEKNFPFGQIVKVVSEVPQAAHRSHWWQRKPAPITVDYLEMAGWEINTFPHHDVYMLLSDGTLAQQHSVIINLGADPIDFYVRRDLGIHMHDHIYIVGWCLLFNLRRFINKVNATPKNDLP